MTTIPNLNVVVQQGHTALEAQNVKSPTQESSQLTAQQQALDEQNRTTVSQSAHAVEIDKDKKESEKRKKKFGRRRNKKTRPEKDPDDTGRILDTIV